MDKISGLEGTKHPRSHQDQYEERNPRNGRVSTSWQYTPWVENMTDQNSYAVSKLMQIFAVREIAARMTKENIKVALNVINPGLAKTELARHATGVSKIGMMVAHALLARTAEEASKTLVYAASVGMESHGLYFTNSDVTK